jgi:hypothetical protein
MKQKIILCIIIATGGFTAHAQTVQTMTQQLAVLHSLQQSLQKGYTLVTHGLQNIGNHQDDEYQQHVRYFNSLYTINPNIWSPSKQTYAQNYDNLWVNPADTNRQTPDSSRPH